MAGQPKTWLMVKLERRWRPQKRWFDSILVTWEILRSTMFELSLIKNNIKSTEKAVHNTFPNYGHYSTTGENEISRRKP